MKKFWLYIARKVVSTIVSSGDKELLLALSLLNIHDINKADGLMIVVPEDTSTEECNSLISALSTIVQRDKVVLLSADNPITIMRLR